MNLPPAEARGRLSVGVEYEPSAVTLTAAGEVDRLTAPTWREAWDGLRHAGVSAPVVLADLTRVTFFGSSGTRVLREVLEETRKLGRTLTVAASRPVRRSAQIAGIASRLTLCETLAEARARTGAPPAGKPGKDPADLVRCLRAENQQLREALESRAVLEQAKGVVMARQQVSPDEAFELLRQLSQHTNVKLRELAAQVVKSAACAKVPPAYVTRAAARRRGN
ncbi:ANTAR domain-containing protein [Amycolatopsis sp. GA6-003]|uniref:ANTAR domain-containing protein n=1 Tax=Amycolatopsis sp. GA6-003 TaxID=2652444 RepID=UPI003916D660